MQIFLDTANVEQVRQVARLGILSGVTTNPSLIAKQGKKYLETVKEVAKLVPGPVSGEVLATELKEMLEQGYKLADIAPNIVVKLPLTPVGLQACKELRSKDIKTNVTLCFSASQALLAAKVGASYISPFVGRLDDVSTDGMEQIEQIAAIYNNYGFDTEVLVASARHPMHIVHSAILGADVVTMPYKVIEQLVKHPLTDLGMERFLRDWEKVEKTK